jgi:hypothetical protein
VAPEPGLFTQVYLLHNYSPRDGRWLGSSGGRENPRGRGLACPTCAEEHHDVDLVDRSMSAAATTRALTTSVSWHTRSICAYGVTSPSLRCRLGASTLDSRISLGGDRGKVWLVSMAATTSSASGGG